MRQLAKATKIQINISPEGQRHHTPTLVVPVVSLREMRLDQDVIGIRRDLNQRFFHMPKLLNISVQHIQTKEGSRRGFKRVIELSNQDPTEHRAEG